MGQCPSALYVIVQYISKYFNIFQYILKYFNIFQYISKYFNIFQDMSLYFNIFQNISYGFVSTCSCKVFKTDFKPQVRNHQIRNIGFSKVAFYLESNPIFTVPLYMWPLNCDASSPGHVEHPELLRLFVASDHFDLCERRWSRWSQWTGTMDEYRWSLGYLYCHRIYGQ